MLSQGDWMLKSAPSTTPVFKEQFKEEGEPIEPMEESLHIYPQTVTLSSSALRNQKTLRKPLKTRKQSD